MKIDKLTFNIKYKDIFNELKKDDSIISAFNYIDNLAKIPLNDKKQLKIILILENFEKFSIYEWTFIIELPEYNKAILLNNNIKTKCIEKTVLTINQLLDNNIRLENEIKNLTEELKQVKQNNTFLNEQINNLAGMITFLQSKILEK